MSYTHPGDRLPVLILFSFQVLGHTPRGIHGFDANPEEQPKTVEPDNVGPRPLARGPWGSARVGARRILRPAHVYHLPPRLSSSISPPVRHNNATAAHLPAGRSPTRRPGTPCHPTHTASVRRSSPCTNSSPAWYERVFSGRTIGGVVEHLQDCPGLGAVIELEVVPHFTTLHKAADRMLRKRAAGLLDTTLNRAAKTRLPRRKRLLAAVDASGFESHHTSHYFVCRRPAGQKHRKHMTYRCFPKMAIVADCTNHLILSAVPGRGPQPDYPHLVQVADQAHDRRRMATLLADAGYDAEWVHQFLRERRSIRSVIPPGAGRPTTKLPTSHWRRLMALRFDKRLYGQRWQCETVFSMIKRRLGATLGARSYRRQCRALMLKAIAHNILILKQPFEVFYRASF